jgi:hypothetical protein
MQFGPSSVEASGIVVSAGIAPPARFPTTTTSADFWPDRSRQISPGKSVMLPCATTAFTSTGKPDDFAVLCQLVVPRRRCLHCFAGRLSPLRSGSMRFLSIGSQVSPSLPSPGRSPFPSWPQMVVSSFSCLVFLQGTCTPFTSRPCWAHTRRAIQPLPAPLSAEFLRSFMASPPFHRWLSLVAVYAL